MNIYKKAHSSFLILFLIMGCQPALAESSVWKVTSGENSIYIGGTIHLLHASDHPLPNEFNTAYNNAQKLVFETDIAKTETAEFQAKMMQAITFQDGRTLESALSPDIYKKLADFFEKRGMNIAQFTLFTPAGAGLMMVIFEYQRMGLVAQLGVDTTFKNKAITDGKEMGSLETPEQQISFIADMANGKENEMIDYTLRDIERIPEYFDQLKKAWREGDLKTMEAAALIDIRKEFPDMHKRLIVQRNNNWLPQIESMLTTKETELVLVGALHLAGKEGLIYQLEQRGYAVTKLGNL